MSLNWDISKVEIDCYDEVGDDLYQLKPVVEAAILGTMIVGMNEITERNYVKWFGRIAAFEQAANPLRVNTYFTLDEVRSLIGLHTNANTNTDAVFNRRITLASLRVVSDG